MLSNYWGKQANGLKQLTVLDLILFRICKNEQTKDPGIVTELMSGALDKKLRSFREKSAFSVSVDSERQDYKNEILTARHSRVDVKGGPWRNERSFMEMNGSKTDFGSSRLSN